LAHVPTYDHGGNDGAGAVAGGNDGGGGAAGENTATAGAGAGAGDCGDETVGTACWFIAQQKQAGMTTAHMDVLNIFAGSDIEITRIMAGLSDELLLANEISYVNGIWEKVTHHRNARKDELKQLRSNFDDLKVFQNKGSGGYLDSMR
jgi:hypothetical protein